jgi:hypothetical protein
MVLLQDVARKLQFMYCFLAVRRNKVEQSAGIADMSRDDMGQESNWVHNNWHISNLFHLCSLT